MQLHSNEDEPYVDKGQLDLFADHREYAAKQKCPFCSRLITVDTTREALSLHLALEHGKLPDNLLAQQAIKQRAKLQHAQSNQANWSMAIYSQQFYERTNKMLADMDRIEREKHERMPKLNGVPMYQDSI